MTQNDLDHMMASLPMEAFSSNQAPAGTTQSSDVYPSIANTENPSNLPRGAVEIPKGTLDDMIPVDENDFIEFSVPKPTHPFDNSYSNTNPVDYSGPSVVQNAFSQANLHDQRLMIPPKSWEYQAGGEFFTSTYQTASIQASSTSFGVEGPDNYLPYRPSSVLSTIQDPMLGVSFNTSSFQGPSMLSPPKAFQSSNSARRGRQQKLRGARNGVKKKSSKVHPRTCLAELENALQEHSKYSPYFKQVLLQAVTMLRPLKQLIDKEIYEGESFQPESENTSLATNSLSQESLSVSEVTDSGYRTEATSISSTPRPQKYDSLECVSQCRQLASNEVEDTASYPCSVTGCGAVYKNRSDWKRHEEIHWPLRRFMCLDCISPQLNSGGQQICRFCQTSMIQSSNSGAHYLQCMSAQETATTFTRKYGLNNHLRNQHGMEARAANQRSKDWHYAIPSDWPTQCPPCRISFRTWEERIEHIATKHYQKGDYRPQGFYPKPKDDDSDDEDFDDNSRPPHKKTVHYRGTYGTMSQNQTQNRPPSTGSANGSWSHYALGRDATADSPLPSPSFQERFGEDVRLGAQEHRRMSVPLERYLNDDEDTTAGLLSAQTFSGAIDCSRQEGDSPTHPSGNEASSCLTAKRNISQSEDVRSDPYHLFPQAAQKLLSRDSESTEPSMLNSTQSVDTSSRPAMGERAARKKLTSYAYFTIEKVAPTGQKDIQTWASRQAAVEIFQSEDIIKRVQRLNAARRTLADKKASSAPFQQIRISMLSDQLENNKIDTNYKWILAQLDEWEKAPKKGQLETTTLSVYYLRTPPENLSATNWRYIPLTRIWQPEFYEPLGSEAILIVTSVSHERICLQPFAKISRIIEIHQRPKALDEACTKLKFAKENDEFLLNLKFDGEEIEECFPDLVDSTYGELQVHYNTSLEAELTPSSKFNIATDEGTLDAGLRDEQVADFENTPKVSERIDFENTARRSDSRLHAPSSAPASTSLAWTCPMESYQSRKDHLAQHPVNTGRYDGLKTESVFKKHGLVTGQPSSYEAQLSNLEDQHAFYLDTLRKLLVAAGGASHEPQLDGIEKSRSNASLPSTLSSGSKKQLQDSLGLGAMRRLKSKTSADEDLMSRATSSEEMPPFSSKNKIAVAKPKYKRPKHERLFCTQCHNHPDGFRGEHELRRHLDREHKSVAKKWACIEPTGGGRLEPFLPLSRYTICTAQKVKYGAYYNAAAHLLRAHFKPEEGSMRVKIDNGGKRNEDGVANWSPLSELMHWMKEVEEPVSTDHLFNQLDLNLHINGFDKLNKPFPTYKGSSHSGASINTDSCNRLASTSEVDALNDLEPHSLSINDSFVVCDAGGGTADLILYPINQLKPDLQNKSKPIQKSGASTRHRRGPWSQGEDAYLEQLVHTQGTLNWVRIAQLIGSRSPKQCRERYHQTLRPALNHEPISAEEGLQIERLVGEMGKHWSEIARRLSGRSDNAVKNWWNGSMNRRRRQVLRRRASGGFPADFDPQSQAGMASESNDLAGRPFQDFPLLALPDTILYPSVPSSSVGQPPHQSPRIDTRNNTELSTLRVTKALKSCDRGFRPSGSTYNQRLDKFGRAIDCKEANADCEGSLEHGDPDQFTCPRCFKTISASRAPVFDSDNCSCTEAAAFSNGILMQRTQLPHHEPMPWYQYQPASPMYQNYHPEYHASSNHSYPCPEGVENLHPDINGSSNFLPLAPEAGLNEALQRPSSHHTNFSYQMRRFLTDQDDNPSMPERTSTPPVSGSQDMHLMRNTSQKPNRTRRSLRGPEAESSRSENRTFMDSTSDPLVSAGSWLDDAGVGAEDGFSYSLCDFIDNLDY